MPEPASPRKQGTLHIFPDGTRVYSETPGEPPPQYMRVEIDGKPTWGLRVPEGALYAATEFREPALGLIAFGDDLSDVFTNLGHKEYSHALDVVMETTAKAMEEAGIDYKKRRVFLIPPEQFERVRKSLDKDNQPPSDAPAS